MQWRIDCHNTVVRVGSAHLPHHGSATNLDAGLPITNVVADREVKSMRLILTAAATIATQHRLGGDRVAVVRRDFCGVLQ
jgi:hypothetical protein